MKDTELTMTVQMGIEVAAETVARGGKAVYSAPVVNMISRAAADAASEALRRGAEARGLLGEVAALRVAVENVSRQLHQTQVIANANAHPECDDLAITDNERGRVNLQLAWLDSVPGERGEVGRTREIIRILRETADYLVGGLAADVLRSEAEAQRQAENEAKAAA